MPVRKIVDRFISRYARPDAAQLALVEHLTPAIVVTGASRGIGKALASRFAGDGGFIVLVARGPAALLKAAEEIRDIFPAARVETISCDMAEDNAAQQLKTAVGNMGGYVDVLVNNAGIGLAGTFVSQNTTEIDNLIALNIEAVTRLTRALLPDMLGRARGGIINIGSLGGYVPGPQQAAYYASKAYVQTFTEGVAYENRGRGVRILVALPGPVTTKFHQDMGADRALYQWIIPLMTPDATAASIIRAYKLGRSVAIPGVLNNLFAVAMRLLPHPIMLPIVNTLLRPFSRNSIRRK